MELQTQWALDWMRAMAASCLENSADLSELDRLLGDGDHGENMARGFALVEQKLLNSPASSPAQVLRDSAITILASVGGAAGPLYGTALLRGAKALENRRVDSAAIVDMIGAGLAGIQARGRAAEGEKTMVDAWAPALREASFAAQAGADPAAVLRASALGAQSGAESTIALVAGKGRASYLGEKSAGHMDPGAYSSALLFAQAALAAEDAR